MATSPSLASRYSANYTAFNFDDNFQSVDGDVLAQLPSGTLWGRMALNGYNDLYSSEQPYSNNVVALQYLDEALQEDGTVGPNNGPITRMADYAAQFRTWNQSYPNALAYTNFWGEQIDSYWPNNATKDYTDLRTFMRTTMPDMMCFDTYPHYMTNTVALWYTHMQKFRLVSLEGYDGAGSTPLPYGQYLDTFRSSYTDPLPTESFIRLQRFAHWAFGYTFTEDYLYNGEADGSGNAATMFSAGGDDPSTKTPVFDYVAEANREGRNLGRALVRLVSTDIRMVPGKVSGKTNTLPDGLSTWSSGGRNTGGLHRLHHQYYATGTERPVESVELQRHVDRLFRPLLADNTGCTFVNGLHFMIVNGTSGDGTAASLAEWFRINFNFGTSGFNSLIELSDDTGEAVLVPLTHYGSESAKTYYLDLNLDGGTGDLFGFWNSSNPLPTVPEPGTLALLATGLIGLLAYAWRKRTNRLYNRNHEPLFEDIVQSRHNSILASVVVFVVAVCANLVAVAADPWQGLTQWTAYSGNPVLTSGAPGAWDEHIRERMAIIYEDGIYKAWYGGWKGAYDKSVPNLEHMGYATSPDGIHWTKYASNPIYTGGWTEDLCVVKSGGTYYMYGEDETNNATTIYRITSTDGLNWGNRATVMTHPGGWCGTPLVWKESSQWYLLYEDQPAVINLATSSDGLNWQKSASNPVMVGAGGNAWDKSTADPASIIKLNGTYYLFYDAYNTQLNNRWSNGIAQSTDLIHWTRYSGNPLLGGSVNSVCLVETPSQYMLYGWNDDSTTPGGSQYSLYTTAKATPKSSSLVLPGAALIGLARYGR